ncbi:MAG TPA: polymer-forming cytoskeletal protein [Rhodothermales bacterium]|nr:polymer-forming cytoskeletal protein [Rhodothermales bacterium]
MGRVALLSLIAFAAVGAVRETQQLGLRRDTEQRDAETRLEMLARNAALYGYERAKQALAVSPGSRTIAGTYDEASYYVQVTYSGGNATFRVKGTASDANGASLPYRVFAKVARESDLPTSAPLFMQFALLTQYDLTLGGTMLIDTFRVEGDTRAPANANIHTNGQLKVTSASALVRGFGTYGTSKNVAQPTKVFRPYSNPTNASVVDEADAVPLPTFTPLDIANKLYADQTSAGSVSLSGTLDFTALGGTKDNPYVWHIKGDLSSSSGTQIKGYVIFVVDGSISLSGGTTTLHESASSESTVAWYSAGDISISGNGEVWGQFYTSGSIKFAGSPSIYGSLAARQGADITGTPKIYYVPASTALTTYWQPTVVRLRRLSYSEGWGG